MKFVPHDYQKKAIEFLTNLPKAGLFLDMGLGKTIITLTVLYDLMFDYFKLKKVLIVAPLRVASSVWGQEIEKWDHLKGLTFSRVLGTERQRIKALEAQSNVYIINRENIPWLQTLNPKISRLHEFNTLVVDELSSFKNASSKRFKALRYLLNNFEYIIGLTGTPATNSLENLWSQIYILDKGERLEKYLRHYRLKYFYPSGYGGMIFKYELKKGAEEVIYSRLKDIILSMRAKDHLKMPEIVYNNIYVDLSKNEANALKSFKRNLFLNVNEDQILASNRAVLTNKLIQASNGAVYDDSKKVIHLHDKKLEALKEAIEEANGQNVLIFYYYAHDLIRIQRYLDDPIELKTVKDFEDWNKGKIPIALAHPQKVGHGINLQFGGHIVIWFSLIWSLENYAQANARIFRQGQTNTVIINHLVTKNSIDEEILQALEGKNYTQEKLLNYLKEVD